MEPLIWLIIALLPASLIATIVTSGKILKELIEINDVLSRSHAKLNALSNSIETITMVAPSINELKCMNKAMLLALQHILMNSSGVSGYKFHNSNCLESNGSKCPKSASVSSSCIGIFSNG